MEKGCKCCLNFAKKCFVSQVTWTAALLVATSLTTFTAFIKIYGLSKVWKAIFVFSLIATIVSYIILVYSFYAARCGNKKHKLILGIILIIYGCIILFFAILFGAIRKTMIKRIDELFDSSDYTQDEKQKIEKSFDCCGTSDCRFEHQDRENCSIKVGDFTRKISNGGTASSIILVLLLWIAAAFCLIDAKACCKEEKDGSLLKSDLEQPIIEN